LIGIFWKRSQKNIVCLHIKSPLQSENVKFKSQSKFHGTLMTKFSPFFRFSKMGIPWIPGILRSICTLRLDLLYMTNVSNQRIILQWFNLTRYRHVKMVRKANFEEFKSDYFKTLTCWKKSKNRFERSAQKLIKNR
jgi:hypothetical protein